MAANRYGAARVAANTPIYPLLDPHPVNIAYIQRNKRNKIFSYTYVCACVYLYIMLYSGLGAFVFDGSRCRLSVWVVEFYIAN